MNIHATIELTRDELLAAVTEAVQNEFRYGVNKLPQGEALSILPMAGSDTEHLVYKVVWGEKPEAQDDVPFQAPPIAAAPTIPEAKPETTADF